MITASSSATAFSTLISTDSSSSRMTVRRASPYFSTISSSSSSMISSFRASLLSICFRSLMMPLSSLSLFLSSSCSSVVNLASRMLRMASAWISDSPSRSWSFVEASERSSDPRMILMTWSMAPSAATKPSAMCF